MGRILSNYIQNEKRGTSTVCACSSLFPKKQIQVKPSRLALKVPFTLTLTAPVGFAISLSSFVHQLVDAFNRKVVVYILNNIAMRVKAGCAYVTQILLNGRLGNHDWPMPCPVAVAPIFFGTRDPVYLICFHIDIVSCVSFDVLKRMAIKV